MSKTDSLPVIQHRMRHPLPGQTFSCAGRFSIEGDASKVQPALINADGYSLPLLWPVPCARPALFLSLPGAVLIY
ncbi:MAG TPA: hypothetical protein ENJ80_07635 [Gammaproteobacteria bacterium]|nr:hypothetical protein [Gammaproteobacteria bacterium]